MRIFFMKDLRESLEDDIDDEVWEKRIDDAVETVLNRLQGSNRGKVAGILGLDKGGLRKDTDEMTVEEKSKAFANAVIQCDHVALKSLSEGTASEGGYLVPDDFYNKVVRALPETASLYSEVTKLPMRRDVMKIPTLVDGPRVYWTDERAAKSTTTSVFSDATLTAYKMAAILYISDFNKSLLVVRLTAKTVNCWDTLTRAISSQARRAIFGKVQRLIAESFWDSNANTSAVHPYGVMI